MIITVLELPYLPHMREDRVSLDNCACYANGFCAVAQGGGSTTELHMAVSLYDVAVSLIKTLAADVKAWNALTSPSAAGRAVAALRGKTAASPPLT